MHRIDPVLADVGGVYLWWYGAGFARGFLSLLRAVLRAHTRLGISRRDACWLVILMTIGVVAGGRGLQILFDEWPFYSTHPRFIPAFWLGGMATHGLLLGAVAAMAGFAARWHPPSARPRGRRSSAGRCSYTAESALPGTNCWEP